MDSCTRSAWYTFIFGIKHITINVKAKYIKGMINDPDLQPNVTINRWITGILLFSFKLIHISMMKHKGVDGLSRRPLTDEDPLEDNDHEDWIDHTYLFRVAILNDRIYCIAGGSADIIRHVHYQCHATQVVRVPVYRVFLDVVQEDSPEPSILRSETVQAIDMSLIRTHEFLISCERPTDLSDHEFAVFIHHAVCFFVLEGNLWRGEPHGRHQLVVQPHKHFHILKEVHDDLGHKGIYTTCVRLLRFWWPHIIKDISGMQKRATNVRHNRCSSSTSHQPFQYLDVCIAKCILI
jgi:hypothetical protein